MTPTRANRKPPQFRRWLILLAVLVLLALLRHYLAPDSAVQTESTSGELTPEKAAAEQISGVMMEVTGTVSRVLSDDNEGSRHQRFILELASGHTLLIAHNIDLARRVPVATGDRVAVRGQYEWNERGGVLHWTHHDPAGRRAGGWIEHEGRRYK
jgi:hypothetical protein